MKTIDYINALIKEKENLSALCKSHVETIRLIKRELVKLNHNMSKKDKQISELEEDLKHASGIKNILKRKKLKQQISLLERELQQIIT